MNNAPKDETKTEKKDSRIAFGANCTWWGTIYEVAKGSDTGKGIPTCPHCGGVLYEDPSMEAWLARLDSVPEDQYPDYRAAMEWQRDNKIHCSRAYSTLKVKYDRRLK